MRAESIHSSQHGHNSTTATSLEGRDWIKAETAASRFADLRLAKRFGRLLSQMSEHIGATVPMACQDWANTKAAYRFFDNERVSEADILAGHFASTNERVACVEGSILVLHDTTSFSYQREDESDLGELNHFRSRRGQKIETAVARGILMHSSLTITPEGLPLGLAAIKFWTRREFKDCNAAKRRINPTRVSIEGKESYRWLENLRQATALAMKAERCVHIADRESDIYELFCTAAELKTHFLVRTCVDRLARDGNCTIAAEMEKASQRGVHRLTVKDRKGEFSEAVLKIKYRRIRVLPPIGKQNQYPALTLTVLHAVERGTPKNREKIEWKLITDLPVKSMAEAIEKLEWYAMRWKIETFHKILKSGCRVEESKLQTAERLANLIAVCCILSWRVFWMTMVRRTAPQSSPLYALTEVEITLLDEIASVRNWKGPSDNTLAAYILRVARLGGYLARANDPPPGNIVMWRGLSRLTDIQLGFAIGVKFVGN